MSPPAIRVASDWLALRGPADAAARCGEFVERVRAVLPAHGERQIHDLACGTGGMGRWLAPQLAGAQRWVLHDLDDDLLALAAAHPPAGARDGSAVTVLPRPSDITHLRPGDLAGAALVTASALLDLLTQSELDTLIDVCAHARCPVLFTLSVVGEVELSPPEGLDDRIAAAFDAHQRRDTGRGALLGPDAPDRAAQAFTRLGYEALVRPSPWRLGAAESPLAAQWFEGWLGAAREQDPALTAGTGDYAAARRAQLGAGRLRVTVGHADLLALPGDQSR